MSSGSMLPFLYASADASGWTQGMVAVTCAMLARLDLASGASVLEVGCGGGAILNALHTARSDLKLTGLDINPLALPVAARSLDRLAQASLLELPFGEETFDLVLALDVVDQAGVPLAESLVALGRVLRPDGCALLRVSAYPWLYGAHDEAFNTGRRFADWEMVDALAQAGFLPQRRTHANTLLAAPVIAMRMLDRLRGRSTATGAYESVLANQVVGAALRLEAGWLRWLPLPFGLSLIVIAGKSALR